MRVSKRSFQKDLKIKKNILHGWQSLPNCQFYLFDDHTCVWYQCRPLLPSASLLRGPLPTLLKTTTITVMTRRRRAARVRRTRERTTTGQRRRPSSGVTRQGSEGSAHPHPDHPLHNHRRPAGKQIEIILSSHWALERLYILRYILAKKNQKMLC